MKRRNLFDVDTLAKVVERIHRLRPDSPPLWGQMSAAQMLAHCAEVQEVMNGKPLLDTPFSAMLFKGTFRKMVVGDKPYKRGSRTHPQYVITDSRDFDIEKSRLLEALTLTYSDRAKFSDVPHPLFGVMTSEEIGWGGYKHLDHHLRQFGV